MKHSQLSKNRLAKKEVITIKDEDVDEESNAQTEEEPGPSGVLDLQQLLDQQENNFKLFRQAARQADERAKKAEDTLKASKRDDERRTEELKKRVDEMSSELGQFKRGGMQLMQQLQLQPLPREEQPQVDLSAVLFAVQRLQAQNEEYREAARIAEKHRQTADEWRSKYVESQLLLDSTSQKLSVLEEKHEQAVRMAKAVHAASSLLATEQPVSLLQPTRSLIPPPSVESGSDGAIEKVTAPSQARGVQGILKRVKTEEGTSERTREEKEKRGGQTRKEAPSSVLATRPHQPVSLQSTRTLAPSDRRENARNGESTVSSEHSTRSFREILKDKEMKKENGESEKSKRNEEKEQEKRKEPSRAAPSSRPKRTLLEALDEMQSEEGSRKRPRKDEEEKKEKEAKKDGASGGKRVKVERMEEAEREIRVKQEK